MIDSNPIALSTALRCYFMRNGHIVASQGMPGLCDIQAVVTANELSSLQKSDQGYDSFEVWDRTRVLHKYILSV
jgi:hypothetical protein